MPRTDVPGAVMSPTVAHILEILQHRIVSGDFRSGERLPTERALAEEFKVSRTTVRQALDTLEYLGFLVRVNGCRPVVCEPPRADRPMAQLARRNIALWITGEPGDVGAYSALQGVQQELDPDRFRLVIANPRGESRTEAIRSEAQFLERLAEDQDISGVILWYLGGEANRAGLERLRAIEMPMVFLDRRPPAGFSADYVGIDNRYAAKQVVRHLLNRGHRRIAHITNPETACTVSARLNGYRDALQEAGIEYDPALVVPGAFQEPETSRYAEIVARLSALSEPPTAVFAVNDYSALCLISALRTAGLRVPQEIEVAGFDDLERWRPGPAMLTTIRQPFERMGTHAARLLLQYVETSHSGSYTSIILDAPLIVRDSVLSARIA